MNSSVTLVGDAIENPANALTMIHAAAMFGAACRFRDTKGLADSVLFAGGGLPAIAGSEVRALHSRIIACDNLPGAGDVYGFHAGPDFALVVGNERRGLSHEFATLATHRVQVPMQSRRIDCLNVAAASAVALYYLCGPRSGPMATRKDPASCRPDLLLSEPADHFELGSTIRSAAGIRRGSAQGLVWLRPCSSFRGPRGGPSWQERDAADSLPGTSIVRIPARDGRHASPDRSAGRSDESCGRPEPSGRHSR
jgi:hypothetical protein